jgi:hypothetical protein
MAFNGRGSERLNVAASATNARRFTDSGHKLRIQLNNGLKQDITSNGARPSFVFVLSVASLNQALHICGMILLVLWDGQSCRPLYIFRGRQDFGVSAQSNAAYLTRVIP